MKEFEEVITKITKHLDKEMTHFVIDGIVNEPKGRSQESELDLFEHEFVDQSGCGDYGFHGDIYYPLPSGKYLAVNYSC